MPTCKELAMGTDVVKMDNEAKDFERQVAEPEMEVAKEYNRYAQEMELNDKKV